MAHVYKVMYRMHVIKIKVTYKLYLYVFHHETNTQSHPRIKHFGTRTQSIVTIVLLRI